MNTITIKNLSTFTDYAAAGRVSMLMAGDKYAATHDSIGNEIIKITCKGNIYTVTDKDVL